MISYAMRHYAMIVCSSGMWRLRMRSLIIIYVTVGFLQFNYGCSCLIILYYYD